MIKYLIIFCLAILLNVLITGCEQNANNNVVSRPATKDSVAVFALQKVAVSKQLSFPAELIPIEKADIFSKVSGYVNTIKTDIGDKVKKGQVLATLEAPEMISNYAQANADVQSSRSKYLGSLDAYKRIVNASKVEGTIAAGELEKAKSQAMADSATLDAAKSKLAAYSELKNYLIIRAPFDGVITERNVDAGTLVGANNNKPLLVVENVETLRLRLPIPEAYTSSIPDSSFIHFTVDAQPGITYKALLSRKTGALNTSNRTETWEFLYKNNKDLKAGMYANALITLKRNTPSFLVPSSAVVTNLEKHFVIRILNGKAEWVDVRNGISLNDNIEIFGNLHEGDQLVVRATDEIKQGSAVFPKMTKPASK